MSGTYNKIIYNGNTLIDLTSDTIDAAHLLAGYTAHDKSGAQITGTNTYDSNTTSANAVADQILSGKTAYVNKNKITGSMTNRGAVTGVITNSSQVYTVPQGYHDGSGTVNISTAEQAKIIPTNIREGIVILGTTGTMSGTEQVNAEAVTVTPTATTQSISPSTGYNYISQVTVNPIPYVQTANATGITVTIG